MNEREFVAYLKTRHQSRQAVRIALDHVREFERCLADLGRDLDSAGIRDIKDYAANLIREKRNTMERFLALARYFYATGADEVYIYFTRILGGLEVLESVSERLAALAGEEVRDRIFAELDAPPLGSPPEAYPPVTALLVERLKELGPTVCHEVLAANHHRIPVESFDKHKAWFAESRSVDDFLKRVHREAVAELERHMKEGRVWYEQVITPEIIQLVRGNQELLSGVRQGHDIYKTKFPYDPAAWLDESDPVRERYHACHCPLAREAILRGSPEIPSDWCYCSGGYGKLMFDVVFAEPTRVEVLESVLAGDQRCRFRIKVPQAILSPESANES